MGSLLFLLWFLSLEVSTQTTLSIGKVNQVLGGKFWLLGDWLVYAKGSDWEDFDSSHNHDWFLPNNILSYICGIECWLGCSLLEVEIHGGSHNHNERIQELPEHFPVRIFLDDFGWIDRICIFLSLFIIIRFIITTNHQTVHCIHGGNNSQWSINRDRWRGEPEG